MAGLRAARLRGADGQVTGQLSVALRPHDAGGGQPRSNVIISK